MTLWGNISWIYEYISRSPFWSFIDSISNFYSTLSWSVYVSITFLRKAVKVLETFCFFKIDLDILKLFSFSYTLYNQLGNFNKSKKEPEMILGTILDFQVSWRKIDILAILNHLIQHVFLHSLISFKIPLNNKYWETLQKFSQKVWNQALEDRGDL